ncbi:hypothetical protein [Streptomyces spongiicola]|nr:hypothetical protein [Streptomyces spongiicola]
MLALVVQAAPSRGLRQRTETTTTQKQILTALGLTEPPRVFEATPSP